MVCDAMKRPAIKNLRAEVSLTNTRDLLRRGKNYGVNMSAKSILKNLHQSPRVTFLPSFLAQGAILAFVRTVNSG